MDAHAMIRTSVPSPQGAQHFRRRFRRKFQTSFVYEQFGDDSERTSVRLTCLHGYFANSGVDLRTIHASLISEVPTKV